MSKTDADHTPRTQHPWEILLRFRIVNKHSKTENITRVFITSILTLNEFVQAN